MPFYSHKDYLFTADPIRYALLFILRQKLDSSTFLVNVNAVTGSLSETLFIIVIQNRTVFFYSSSSVFGLFKLVDTFSWQKLVVSFSNREISVTQECAEFSFLSLPSKPNFEHWEKIAVTVQAENSQDNTQVCKIIYLANIFTGLNLAVTMLLAQGNVYCGKMQFALFKLKCGFLEVQMGCSFFKFEGVTVWQ